MEVENVARIGLASRRLAGQQRDLAVRGGMPGEVVEHDERMTALIAEIFRHGERGKWRDPLQPRCGSRARDHEDAAFRRAMAAHLIDHARDTGGFLADRDIDAYHVARPLVDDRIDGERGLAGRAVAQDQLALAAAEREHRVDDQYPGLHRLNDEVALDNRRRGTLHRLEPLGDDRRPAVEWPAEWIDDTAEQSPPHLRAHHCAGARDDVPRLDAVSILEHHAADAIAVERLYEARLTSGKLQQFVEPGLRQTRDQRYAIADGFDAADLADLCADFRRGHARRGPGKPFIRGARHDRPP